MSDRQAILDLPKMNGLHWMPSHEIAQAMLDAWPFWEHNGAYSERAWSSDVVYSLILGSGLGCWRPLRLPGMNELGYIKGSDMTEAHFERVEDWQVLEYMGPLCPSTRAMIESPREYDLWRPAVFARLDDRIIEPEPACNCDQALTAERDRDALQYRVKGMVVEIHKLRLALISQSADTVYAKASLKAFEQRLADVKDRAGEATRSV